jgi:hypothetical protein
MNKEFNKKDLTKTDIQYKIINMYDFSIGEKVFLKSNPEVELIIIDFDYSTKRIYTNYGDFPYQCLSKYDGNIIYKKHNLNLN